MFMEFVVITIGVLQSQRDMMHLTGDIPEMRSSTLCHFTCVRLVIHYSSIGNFESLTATSIKRSESSTMACTDVS